MGSTMSKEGDKEEEVCKAEVPSTPIQATRQQILGMDPRSPSANIARTPIEIMKTPLSKLESSANEDTPLKVVSLIDPRSPTLEIYRTPIVIKDFTNHRDKPHNKLLDNAKKNTFELTPCMKKTEHATRAPKKSPILLESSPLAVKLTANKRHSLVGLLETNLDFVETNIDEVYQTKMENPSNLSTHSEEAADEQTKEDFTVAEDKNSENADDLVVADDEENEQNEEDNCTTDAQTIKLMNSVDELDKRLSELIYADKIQINSTAAKIRGDNRTPLADKNSCSKSKIPKLKVNDQPTKLSKIPVLKQKNCKGNHIQCENTPPRVREDKKILGRPSQWCAEDSIII